jgi:hypothetical protein
MWVAVGYFLWSRLCACGSALGLSGSGSCGSGLAGFGDIDHVRVMQPVAGPGRPYAPRGLEPTTDVVFVGTLFHRATNTAGKSGRITGSAWTRDLSKRQNPLMINLSLPSRPSHPGPQPGPPQTRSQPPPPQPPTQNTVNYSPHRAPSSTT